MLTGARLEQLLTYDQLTGIFRWRGGHKRVIKGAIAGTSDKEGYIIICIDQRLYKAHRLAWLWMTGAWPKEQIDHIDMVRSNNAFVNLREASAQQNARNRRKRGFTFEKRRNTYVAHINLGGKCFYLGYFQNSEDATAAYNAAAAKHHGEFMRAAQ